MKMIGLSRASMRGAWIEISRACVARWGCKVAPTRARGLKSYDDAGREGARSRAHAGAWIEMGRAR